MIIFLDTASVAEVQRYVDIIDGITTNPSMLAKEGKDFYTAIKDLCTVANGLPISVEVSANTYHDMLLQGKKICAIADNIVLKLPLTLDGLKLCKFFSQKLGRSVNMTLCFSMSQAILAARAGATYVSPFVGRLEDVSEDGMHLLNEIQELFLEQGMDTLVLAASIRTSGHFLGALRAGVDAVTISPALLAKLIGHPLTDKGIETFTNDWNNSGLII